VGAKEIDLISLTAARLLSSYLHTAAKILKIVNIGESASRPTLYHIIYFDRLQLSVIANG